MTLRTILDAITKRFGYTFDRFRPERDAYLHQKRLLKDNVRTIFDIGAHEGQTVRKYRKLAPEAKIYSFEPSPTSFQNLSAKYGAEPNVRLHNVAIADAVGQSTFCLNQYSQTNSLLPSTDESQQYQGSMGTLVEEITVETRTIDSMVDELQIKNIDILKLDIQGGELRALQGATETFARGGISLVYAEVLFVNLYENQAWFHDIDKFLQDRNYKLCGLYDTGISPSSGQLLWCDATWIRSDLLKTT